MRLVRQALLLLTFGLLLGGAYRSVRIAYADHLYRLGDSDSVARAIGMEPGRALYRAGLGELLASSAGDARATLRKSVELSPSDANLRIRLGLELETWGEFAEAERELLASAQISAKYAPRWTLMNYYYRRGVREEFWRWTRQALETSYRDRRPVFDLCWAMSPSPAVILDRAVPARRPVRLDYAWYLATRGEWTTAAALMKDLAREAHPGEQDRLVGFVDALLNVKLFPQATAVWNSLARRSVVPFDPPEPKTGSGITNGDFASPPSAHGFDWRIVPTDGVFIAHDPARGLSLSLSGTQPETCEILHQYFPVEPLQYYRLECDYQNSTSRLFNHLRAGGLEWRVQLPGTREPWRAIFNLSGEEGDHHDRHEFLAPRGVSMARLVLLHHRQRGAMKMEGDVLLKRVKLQHLGPFRAE